MTSEVEKALETEKEYAAHGWREQAYQFKRADIATEALRSIATNTCCDSCQEAARVARGALECLEHLTL